MKLPLDSDIPLEKLTHYLLIFNEHNDKSKFLAQGGYTLDNWSTLEEDLRKLLHYEAVFQKQDVFGEYFIILGQLRGDLWVKTVWFKETGQKTFRFITLIPQTTK